MLNVITDPLYGTDRQFLPNSLFRALLKARSTRSPSPLPLLDPPLYFTVKRAVAINRARSWMHLIRKLLLQHTAVSAVHSAVSRTLQRHQQ